MLPTPLWDFKGFMLGAIRSHWRALSREATLSLLFRKITIDTLRYESEWNKTRCIKCQNLNSHARPHYLSFETEDFAGKGVFISSELWLVWGLTSPQNEKLAGHLKSLSFFSQDPLVHALHKLIVGSLSPFLKWWKLLLKYNSASSPDIRHRTDDSAYDPFYYTESNPLVLSRKSQDGQKMVNHLYSYIVRQASFEQSVGAELYSQWG